MLHCIIALLKMVAKEDKEALTIWQYLQYHPCRNETFVNQSEKTQPLSEIVNIITHNTELNINLYSFYSQPMFYLNLYEDWLGYVNTKLFEHYHGLKTLLFYIDQGQKFQLWRWSSVII